MIPDSPEATPLSLSAQSPRVPAHCGFPLPDHGDTTGLSYSVGPNNLPSSTPKPTALPGATVDNTGNQMSSVTSPSTSH